MATLRNFAPAKTSRYTVHVFGEGEGWEFALFVLVGASPNVSIISNLQISVGL